MPLHTSPLLGHSFLHEFISQKIGVSGMAEVSAWMLKWVPSEQPAADKGTSLIGVRDFAWIANLEDGVETILILPEGNFDGENRIGFSGCRFNQRFPN